MALYRKYRPRSLDEIIGQDHITHLFKQAIAADAVSHAYLLTGPRGVGKTSTARIIAHEINQLPYEDESSHLDIVEIDAASNNGVEDVRDLREKVHIAPSSARKKVYIIDEVHMLSKAAFNALLKTLEEPPAHVVFVLVTTDAEKLPQTIISRVQRFNFRTVSRDEAVAHLAKIADSESISADKEALGRIADYGEGSFRDSIGLLDQLKDSVAPATITINDVNATLGASDSQTIERLLSAHAEGNFPELVKLIDSLEAGGVSPKTVSKQLIDVLTSQLASKPTQLPLLDELTKLNLSQYPYLRLLIALSKDIPSTAPQPTAPTASPIASKPPRTKSHNDAPKPDKPAKDPTEVQDAKPAPASKPLDSFSWSDFSGQVKQDSTAAATLLGQSDYKLDGPNLTIYTKQAFRAKRLQSAKYTILINKALAALGFSNLVIEVSPDAPPSENSSVANVTDIMGGGEEVSVNAS